MPRYQASLIARHIHERRIDQNANLPPPYAAKFLISLFAVSLKAWQDSLWKLYKHHLVEGQVQLLGTFDLDLGNLENYHHWLFITSGNLQKHHHCHYKVLCMRLFVCSKGTPPPAPGTIVSFFERTKSIDSARGLVELRARKCTAPILGGL